MKGFLKSRKALSPVVAAIILIAVTVAVSIAVAAWMGALTFTFMQTEELSFIAYTWGSNNSYIELTIRNIGSQAFTVSDVQVSGSSTTNNALTTPLDPGSQMVITVTKDFESGVKYEFTVITAKGNAFGPYIKTAP